MSVRTQRNRALRAGAAGLAVAATLSGCLPDDTRPPPAEVLVNVRGAPSAMDGVTTSDGWAVRFDRVLVTIGGVDLEGDACDEYADADYTRVLDARQPGPQKLGLIYGLGTCELELRARNPESDSLLGVGVTEADRFAMREPGADPWESFAGVTFLVRGEAVKGAARKSFEWKYRRGRLRYDECTIDGRPITLSRDERRTIEVRIHPETLLQRALEPNGALRFDPIAAADADGDDVVTLEELAEVPLADVDPGDAPEAASWKTFGDFFYDGLFPRIVRLDDAGVCNIRLRRPGE